MRIDIIDAPGNDNDINNTTNSSKEGVDEKERTDAVQSNNSGNIHKKHAKVVNKSNGNDNITIIDSSMKEWELLVKRNAQAPSDPIMIIMWELSVKRNTRVPSNPMIKMIIPIINASR